MTLTASDGDAIGSGAGTLTVTNAPPSVAIGTPAAGTLVLAGDPVAVQATFTDPGTNDTHACAINWGDGSTTAGVLSESPAVCSGARKYAAAAGPRTITVTVADDDGGAGTASVSIAIYTARSLKQGARDRAAALLASATHRNRDELRDVVRNLDDSLDRELWIDGNTLEPKHGEKVFEREEKAVDAFVDLKRDGDLPAALVQPLIDALENADRILAENALASAVAASGIPREIAEARAWLARAGAARAAGRFELAIEDYEHAWEEALEAVAPLHHHVH